VRSTSGRSQAPIDAQSMRQVIDKR
jgi:hypothetical protein